MAWTVEAKLGRLDGAAKVRAHGAHRGEATALILANDDLIVGEPASHRAHGQRAIQIQRHWRDSTREAEFQLVDDAHPAANDRRERASGILCRKRKPRTKW